VPGVVLVKQNTAYFVAGRQQLTDGGVLIFAINPLTGKKQWVHRLDSIPQKDDPTGKDPFKGFYENSGLEFDPVDILHQENGGVGAARLMDLRRASSGPLPRRSPAPTAGGISRWKSLRSNQRQHGYFPPRFR
jgi:hypothetical protein